MFITSQTSIKVGIIKPHKYNKAFQLITDTSTNDFNYCSPITNQLSEVRCNSSRSLSRCWNDSRCQGNLRKRTPHTCVPENCRRSEWALDGTCQMIEEGNTDLQYQTYYLYRNTTNRWHNNQTTLQTDNTTNRQHYKQTALQTDSFIYSASSLVSDKCHINALFISLHYHMPVNTEL